MKSIGLLCFLGLALFACVERTEKQMVLYLKNETNDTLKVRISPKKATSIELYPASDRYGNYLRTTFDLTPGQVQEIYLSSNTNQTPEELTASIFQSIAIFFNKSPDAAIYFSADSLFGYSENPFLTDAPWRFELVQSGRPTQFKQNPIELSTYTLAILPSKQDQRKQRMSFSYHL